MAETQNFGNHKKYVLGYHGIAFALTVFWLGWSIKELAAAPSVRTAAGVAAVSAFLLVLFVVVHVVMVVVSGLWNNLRSMISGRYAILEEGAAR